MRKNRTWKSLLTVLALPCLLAVALQASTAPSLEGDGDKSPGEMAFVQLKCHLCHEVSSVGIERTSKSEKMKGRDLAGIGDDFDPDFARRWIQQEELIDGEKHKKPFKGTDEELEAILDWLGSLETAE